MIISNRSIPTSRSVQALILGCAMVFLPPSLTSAQEPDYEAVGDRLIEAVEEGELTPEQAEAMMGALARDRFARRLQEEETHRKEEEEETEELDNHLMNLGLQEEMVDQILNAFGKYGIDEELHEEALWGVIKLVHAMKSKQKEGDYAQILHYLKKIDLDGKQVELVEGIAKKILHHHQKSHREGGEEKDEKDRWSQLIGHYNQLGVSDEMIKAIATVLHKADLEKRQIEGSLGAMLRIVHQMRSEGDRYQRNRRVAEYLMKEVRLDDEQVALVEGIARRIVRGTSQEAQRKSGASRPSSSEEDRRRRFEAANLKIRKAVADGKISREDARKRMEDLRKRMGPENVEKKHDDNQDLRSRWEAIKKRIEGAVQRGEMTREEADRKYRELRMRMGKEKRPDPRRKEGETKRSESPSREEMGRIKERIWAGVKAGKITEEQAKERWEGYLKQVRGSKIKLQRSPSREEMGEVRRKIGEAVKAGKITEKEAKKEWEAYMKRFRESQTKEKRPPDREEMGKVKERIWAAVKAGLITEEQAKERWEGYLKRVRSSQAR
jgi:hypothetical protein